MIAGSLNVDCPSHTFRIVIKAQLQNVRFGPVNPKKKPFASELGERRETGI
jgi:hypothetical protein